MTDFPPALSDAVRRAADGLGRKGLAASSAAISEHYRRRGASRQVIGGAGDVLAYALSRMPATYAAVSRVLDELGRRAPDFVPDSALDAGAGPGTAGWAVAEAFAGTPLTLVDHSNQFLDLAASLAKETSAASVELIKGDFSRLELDRRFGLVTCAYALTELADDALLAAAERLWRHCAGVLVIVEPGRPRDYQRLMLVRQRLVELGGTVLAPCPHNGQCPLAEPDWCHFSVRLRRTRDHMRLKGGTLGYEDEKFSYLVIAREAIGSPAPGRVLRRPEESKFAVTMQVCAARGLEQQTVASRDRPAFKAAKKLAWGDESA